MLLAQSSGGLQLHADNWALQHKAAGSYQIGRAWVVAHPALAPHRATQAASPDQHCYSRNYLRHVCQSADYIANVSDEGVLRLPHRTELRPDEITHVFGYSRDFGTKYFVGKVLGCGSFGVVRECLERSTGRRYAVKTVEKLPKRGSATPRSLLKMRAEVEIMQQLGNSLDAVNLKDVFEDDDCIHLVMQLCEGGALLERLEEARYSEKYIARLVRSVLRFISQCHAKGFVYRDVKPENFLFLNKDPDSPLKATDFGLSIRHRPEDGRLSSRSGTPAYMAPELVLQSYNEKCDIWSVGMLTYQLLTGRFPYWDDIRDESLTDVWKAILTKEINWRAPELRGLSPSAISFLKTLLTRDMHQRPSAFEALEHAWVKEEGTAADLPLQGSVVQRLQRFSTYGHLKQLVLKMIVDKMRSERSTRQASGASRQLSSAPLRGADISSTHLGGLEELFRMIDTDRSGGISLNELSEGLKRQGYQLTEGEMEQLGRKMDFNNNDDIDLTEFITTLMDWSVLQRTRVWQGYLDEAFSMLDLDGNGYISLEELLAQLRAQMNERDEAQSSAMDITDEAKQMLREADSNGDGRISRQEFYALLKDNIAQDSLSLYDDRLDLEAVQEVPVRETVSAMAR